MSESSSSSSALTANGHRIWYLPLAERDLNSIIDILRGHRFPSEPRRVPKVLFADRSACLLRVAADTNLSTAVRSLFE